MSHVKNFNYLKITRRCYVCDKPITIMDGLSRYVHAGLCKQVYTSALQIYERKVRLAKDTAK